MFKGHHFFNPEGYVVDSPACHNGRFIRGTDNGRPNYGEAKKKIAARTGELPASIGVS